MDDTARGAILGMTLETTSIDIYHALMEGVAFEMRTNMETLREQGVRFDVLRATGGGANSRVWLQMKADILGLPITALKNGEAGTVGACMIASVALGKHRDLEDAARDYIRLGRVYEPDPARAARYDALYEKYQRMYAGLKDILR